MSKRTRGSVITQLTSSELLQEVERLRPVIESNGARAEAERQLPDQVYEAMIDAKLFDICAPRAYGGLELHPVEAMRVWGPWRVSTRRPRGTS